MPLGLEEPSDETQHRAKGHKVRFLHPDGCESIDHKRTQHRDVLQDEAGDRSHQRTDYGKKEYCDYPDYGGNCAYGRCRDPYPDTLD